MLSVYLGFTGASGVRFAIGLILVALGLTGTLIATRRGSGRL
jgi:hypothetical protein